MNRMWSVLTMPYLVLTAVPSTSGNRSRCTPWRLTSAPLPSLLRGFSAPVKLSFPYSRDQLMFLMQHDSDGFNRWEAGQQLAVHAWIYGLDDGCIHDLGLDVRGREQLPEAYNQAVTQLTRRWTGDA